MKLPLKLLCVFVLTCSIFGAPISAYAFPAKDLMDVFSPRERHVYVAALVHMASYQSVLDGNEVRAKCIIDWYHVPDHTKATLETEKYFAKYPDREAAAIILVLIKSACDKSESPT